MRKQHLGNPFIRTSIRQEGVFSIMVSDLVRSQWPTVPPVARQNAEKALNRTESIRQLLREQGPMRSSQIATAVDLDKISLVGALLKADIRRGRVTRVDEKYAWNHDHDEQLAAEIAAAVILLRRHGYAVAGKAVHP